MTDKEIRARIVAAIAKYGANQYSVCNNQQVSRLQRMRPRCRDECACPASVSWRKLADTVLTQLGL